MMKRFIPVLSLSGALALTVGMVGAASTTGTSTENPPVWDSGTGRLDPASFAEPPSTDRPHAFWFWNGELTEEELDRQLDEMSANGVDEFFIHPREGLGGEYGESENEYYLSTDYFDKVGFVLEQARDRGMKAWLYDDLNWPSGFAGGRTIRGGEVDGRPLEADPEYVPWYLTPIATDVAGGTTYDAEVPVQEGSPDPPEGLEELFADVDPELVASLALPVSDDGSCTTDGQARGAALDGDRAIELTDEVDDDGRLRWEAPEGDDWCLVHLVQRPLLSYHPDHEPGEPYVDMLNPAATEKFIDITHETYAARFGEYLGSTVPGIFNDEPGFYNNFPDDRGGVDSRGSIPWTPGFRDYLADNAGYDVTGDLAALWYDTGAATTRTRVAFYDALSDRYNEAHTVPLAEWANDHDIALISNPLVEEDLGSHRLIAGGSWFEMQREYHLPGMDLISGLDTSAVTPKLNSSVAHLFQRPRNLSETFGAFGWDLTMEEMKRTNAWQITGGVDLIDNHAFYYSTDGRRAAESPPSQFFQNTFWPRFPAYAELTGRLVEPARGATPVNPVGLLYPSSSVMATGTPWDVRGFAGNGSDLGPIDASWKDTSNVLLRSQLDFDYLDELALAGDPDLGVDISVTDGRLVLGEQEWQALVLPATAVLDLRAVDLMEDLVADGGTVVAVDALPTREAGGADAELATRLTALFGTDPADPERAEKDHLDGGMAAFLPSSADLSDVLHSRVTPGMRTETAQEDLRVRHVRRGADHAFLVTNLSGDPVRTGATFDVPETPEFWYPETGETTVAPVFTRRDESTDVDLDLDPYEARWVVFRPGSHPPSRTLHLTATNGTPESVTASDSGLHATVVVDEPGEVYAVGAHRNRAFAGTTTVDDDLEPLPVDGDWHLEFATGDTAPVTGPLGSWTGLAPEYSGAATYTAEVEVPADFIDDERRIQLDLGEVRELAAVSVNGGATQHLDWSPYVVDVTEDLRVGTNTIAVTVTNTPANAIEQNPLPSGLLGPVTLTPQRVVDVPMTPDAQVTSYVFTVEPGTVTAQPGGTATVTATVEGVAPETLDGTVTAQVPDGWHADPARTEVSVDSSGQTVRSTKPITVTVPDDAAEGDHDLTVAFVGSDGARHEHVVTVRVTPALAAWEFETDDDPEGWTAGTQVTPLRVADGALSFSSTGGDPNVMSPDLELPLSVGASVQIEMASSVAGAGQLFWATTDGGFAETRSGSFDVVAGDGTYTIPIPAQEADLMQLRLDPLRTTGDLRIDSVRVLP